MKEIHLDTKPKMFAYYFSWFFFILLGFGILWIIAFIFYWKDYDKPNKKNILNKTHQKLILIYGLTVGGLFLIMLIIDLIQMQFTGYPL